MSGILSRGCPRNCERLALPTDGHWETGKAGHTRRPASQETYRRSVSPSL